MTNKHGEIVRPMQVSPKSGPRNSAKRPTQDESAVTHETCGSCAWPQPLRCLLVGDETIQGGFETVKRCDAAK